jgi:hypothetical protein
MLQGKPSGDDIDISTDKNGSAKAQRRRRCPPHNNITIPIVIINPQAR